VLVALILVFLPGLIAALLLRAPWLPALALAPALSTTSVVLMAAISSAAGVPWGPVPLVAGVLGVWVMAAVLGALIRRHTPPEEPNRLPVAALVVTAVAAIAVAVVLLPVSHSPEAFPQHPDTIFHLGAAQWMVEHHDASFLHAEAFRRFPGLGFYPAAFHAMVATVAQLTGASVVVSTSSFVLVIAGVVWPIGCIFLARTLFGSDLAVTISAGVVSVAFSTYPFMLMGYGVLWPNLFAQALLPGALALLAIVLSAAHRLSPPLTSRLRATVLLLATLPAVVLAHVNAFVAFVLFGYVMAAGVILGRAWERRRRRPRMAVASVAGLLGATGLAFLATTVLEPKGGSMRLTPGLGPEFTLIEALSNTLLFAPRGAVSLWVLAALVPVGAGVILVRHRGSRWVVAAAVMTSALLFLNLAVDNPTVRLVTWPWNNQSPRLAALIVLPAILLATAALAAGAQLLKGRMGLPPAASAVAVPLLFVLATGGLYTAAHQRVLNPYFNPIASRSWVTKGELRALQTLARHVPPDAVVAENPWKGGSYMYVVSSRNMLFPTEKDRADGDRKLLALSLDEVGRSPKVCAAAQREHVRFAITGGRAVNSAGKIGLGEYPGVDAIGWSEAFRKVAHEAPYTLYEMVSCAKG